MPASLTYIEGSMFYGCNNLETITFSARITNLGSGGFFECSSLAEINYPGTLAQWSNLIQYNSIDHNTCSYVVHCTDGDIEK